MSNKSTKERTDEQIKVIGELLTQNNESSIQQVSQILFYDNSFGLGIPGICKTADALYNKAEVIWNLWKKANPDIVQTTLYTTHIFELSKSLRPFVLPDLLVLWQEKKAPQNIWKSLIAVSSDAPRDVAWFLSTKLISKETTEEIFNTLEPNDRATLLVHFAQCERFFRQPIRANKPHP